MNYRPLLPTALAAVLILSAAGCARDEPAAVIARAVEQIDAGDYRRAAVELRNAIQAAPDDSPEHVRARILLGQASLALGDVQTAEQQLLRARELGAAPEAYALLLARALTALGRSAEAPGLLDTVPESARAADWSIAMAGALAPQGRLVDARQLLEEVLRAEPHNHAALTMLAAVLAAGGDFPGARAVADRAVAAGGGDAGAMLLRARLRLQAGATAAALEDLHAAIELEARTSLTAQEIDALALLAQIQVNSGQAVELTATRDRLRQRAPGLPLTAFVEGAVDYLAQDYRNAIPKLQEALRQAPDNEQTLVLLGASFLATDNLGQAEQALRRVVFGPGAVNPTAIRLLAETRRRQGSPDLALALLRELPESEQDPQLLAMIGLLSVEAGQVAEGVIHLERAAAAAPGQAAIQLQLARAYLAAGRRGEALAMFDGPFGSDAEEAVLVAIDLLSAQGADRNIAAARDRAAGLLADRPDDAQVAMGVALYFQSTGDAAAARSAIHRALELQADFVSAWLSRGAMELAAGEPAAAQASFQAVTRQAPDNHRGWLGLAQVAALDGAQDEARRLTLRATEVAPAQVAPWLALAQFELRAGNLSALREITARLRQLDAGSADVVTLVAVLAAQDGELEVALREFRRAADAQPRRADRWQNLAQAQFAAGQVEAGRDSLRTAMDLAPQVPQIRYALGQIEAQLGNDEQALELGRGLQRDFPGLPEGYLLQASIQAARGDHREAALLFEQAWAVRPAFEIAAAAYQARRRGELPEPDRLLRDWLVTSPNDVRALVLLGEYLSATDEAAALQHFERAIMLDAANLVALNNAAWLLRERAPERALDHARRAHALAPDSAPVLDTLGWILVLGGQPAEGLPHLRLAMELAPQSADIRYHYAVALSATGQTDPARQILRELLREQQPFSYREQAQALLERL